MQRMPSPPRMPAWLLERLLAAPALEYALGDLAEEYALRVEAGSTRAADHWYWMQLVRSLPALFGHAVRSAGALRTLAVAIAIHLGASVAESLAQGGIQMLPLGNVAAGIMSVIVGLVAFACGGYVAARIRQPAALFMAAITFALVVFLMVTRGDALPIWYQILYLVLGPLAPMAGGAVASRQRLRQIHE